MEKGEMELAAQSI